MKCSDVMYANSFAMIYLFKLDFVEVSSSKEQQKESVLESSNSDDTVEGYENEL